MWVLEQRVQRAGEARSAESHLLLIVGSEWPDWIAVAASHFSISSFPSNTSINRIPSKHTLHSRYMIPSSTAQLLRIRLIDSARCSLVPPSALLRANRPPWSPAVASRPPELSSPRPTTTPRDRDPTFPSTPSPSGSPSDTGPSWPPASALLSLLPVGVIPSFVGRFRDTHTSVVWQTYKPKA